MKMLIGGRSVTCDRLTEVVNPYDGSVIDTVPSAGEEEVRQAITAAEAGAEIMRLLPRVERSAILNRTALAIESETDNLAQLLAAEVGKTLREARGEVARAVQTFTLAAEVQLPYF